MVIFTVGCNFQCEFCHNKHLLQNDAGRGYQVSELLQKIKLNKLVSSVSITGGEPSLQLDLIEVCEGIKKMEKYLSIDTNGSNPNILSDILKYADRVALDFKSPLIPRRLKKVLGVYLNEARFRESFELLNHKKGLDFEIRTTMVQNLHTIEDIHQILEFLIDNHFRGTYVLQQYQYNEGVGEKFKDKFQKPEHHTLITILRPYVSKSRDFKIYLRDDIEGYELIENIVNKIE